MTISSALIKNYSRYNQKIIELINEYEQETDKIRKLMIQMSLPDKARALIYSFLLGYQKTLQKKSTDIEDLSALEKKLQAESTIEKDSPLLYLINKELEKLTKKKQRTEYYKYIKEEHAKHEILLAKENDKKFNHYSAKSLDDLKKELQTNYYDRPIIERAIQNQKSNLDIDDFYKELDEFRLHCQKEKTEKLQELIKNEEISDNEKAIIRAELRSRYGIS